MTRIARYSISIGNILHPTDFSHGSHTACAHALKLAHATQGSLTILHVDPEGGRPDWHSFPSVRDFFHKWGMLPEDAHRSDVSHLGVTIHKAAVDDDNPASGILRHLEHHPADLIVLATHQRQGLDRWLHREVAEKVNNRTNGATLFIPFGVRGFIDAETGESHLHRILLPVDAVPHPQPAVEVAADIVNALCTRTCGIRLLHVGDPAGQPAPQLPSSKFVEWHWANRPGNAVDTILSEASDQRADLIVMTTCGRHGFLDALRGSTTEQVLHHAPCPVLAVHAWEI